MADFARYLPLSQHSGADERGVTSDRRAPTATVLGGIATALRAADDTAWNCPTEREGRTVAHVVAELVAGFDRSPARRAFATARRALAVDDGAAVIADDAPDGCTDAAAALEARAAVITARPQPTRIVELDDAVVAAILIGRALGVTVPIPPLASGAVALRRAAAAPTAIRAVISGHSLHATDAAWSIGHGAPLVGTADELLRFLTGVGLTAPRPPRDGDFPASADGGRIPPSP